jgi:hypothetical protein
MIERWYQIITVEIRKESNQVLEQGRIKGIKPETTLEK